MAVPFTLAQLRNKQKGISEDIETVKLRRALAEKAAQVDALQVRRRLHQCIAVT